MLIAFIMSVWLEGNDEIQDLFWKRKSLSNQFLESIILKVTVKHP